jgi:predicted DNA-binding antitoxin AbrB/MazE fold protein
MAFDVDAIFDHGVFRPLEPLALPEGLYVHLQVQQAESQASTAQSPDAEGAAARKAGLAEFLEQMSALPIEGRQDPFSGADHDRELYGQP